MFDELLDEDPYLLDRDVHVAQKAKLEQLQNIVVDVVQNKFPDLAEFTQSKVAQITNPAMVRTGYLMFVEVSLKKLASPIFSGSPQRTLNSPEAH